MIGLVSIISVIMINGVSGSTHDLGKVDVDTKDFITVQNKDSPKFVKVKPYSSKSDHTKTRILTKSGKKYVYVTKYFLPTSWKNGGKNGKTEYWYNVQSIAMNGKYMYILSYSGYAKNTGFIIRYDTKLMDKYKLFTSNGFRDLRRLGESLRYDKKLSAREMQILKAIKVGHIINVGHGQSLSFNPKDKSLYLLRGDSVHASTTIKMVKINMKTLKPQSIYKFKVRLKDKLLNKIKNLAFDKEGNFYFNRGTGSKSTFIFKGQFIDKKLKIKLLLKIQKPGTYIQGISINSKLNKFYIFSDSVIYSMPLAKLANSTLTKKDLEYSIFGTRREFEGLTFDREGRSYLLIVRGNEVLRATKV